MMLELDLEQSPLFVPMQMWCSTPPGMLALGLEAAATLVIIRERGTFDSIAQGDAEQSRVVDPDLHRGC